MSHMSANQGHCKKIDKYCDDKVFAFHVCSIWQDKCSHGNDKFRKVLWNAELCMLKQIVRLKRIIWIENDKPRFDTVWASMIAVKKLYKGAIKQTKLIKSDERGQYVKNLLLHNDGKFWKE